MGKDFDSDFTKITTLTATTKWPATQTATPDGWVEASDMADYSLAQSNAAFANLIINGGMQVAQLGTSFTSATTPANNDDTYTLDQWILLSDGNDIVDVTQSTDAPTGALYSLSMDVETANKKFGVMQPLERRDCVGVIGGQASLSVQLKTTGSSLTNVKAVVLSWNSTADTITSDVVSAWGADGVTPTWAANWTAENTPANLSVTTSWAEYRIEGISVDTASAKNLAVFIWSDKTTTTLTDTLLVSAVSLVPGVTARAYQERGKAAELVRCKWSREIINTYHGWILNATTLMGKLSYSEKRTTPSIATSGTITIFDGASGTFSASASVGTSSIKATGSPYFRLTGFTGLTSPRQFIMIDGSLIIRAQL